MIKKQIFPSLTQDSCQKLQAAWMLQLPSLQPSSSCDETAWALLPESPGFLQDEFFPSFSSSRGLPILCPSAQSQSCILLPGSCENRRLRGIVHSWNLSVLQSVITHPGSFSFPGLSELSSLNAQVLQGLESCQPPAAQLLKETWAHFHNLGERTNKQKNFKKHIEQIQNRRGKSSVSSPLTASFTFTSHKKNVFRNQS